MRPESRKNSFDTLRLLFAVMVVFSHSFPMLRGTNATEPLSRLTHGVMNLGQVAVSAFFIISGYLITGSWQRSPHPWRFLKRRVLRIYPGFVVATCVCAAVVAPMAASPGLREHISMGNYLSHTLRLLMFNEGHPFDRNPIPHAINGSLWSISFEFWCYIGVVLLGLTRLLSKRMVIVGLFLAAMIGHLILEVFHLSPGGMMLGRVLGSPVLWARVLPFFLAGMLFKICSERIELRTSYACAAFLCLATSVLIPHATVFTLPVLGSYLVLWLAYLPALQRFNLARWGDFSYGTYLYAFPIQQLLTAYFFPGLTPFLLFAIAAPLSLAAGVLSWYAVEHRFLPRAMISRLEERPANLSVIAHPIVARGEL